MVHAEKRLLWHPGRKNKFVVGGGSQINLYELVAGQLEIRHVTSHHDLQHLKCFAWSPDPAMDDLIAVGNTTGKIDILRMESLKYSHRTKTLPNGQGTSLQIRHSRSCNALAFSPGSPNLLASGFDKVRGDPSLIIWDVRSTAAALSLTLPLPSPSFNEGYSPMPPLPPPVETTRTMDSRIVHQHAPTETVSALSFLPHFSQLLLASISYRWLRLFDLRTPVPTNVNITSRVEGIATCPFDPHRFACFGEELITVWDARNMGGKPVLSFSERDAIADGAVCPPGLGPGFSGIEFSGSRRGLLGSLTKEASYVRFWNIMGPEGKQEDALATKDFGPVVTVQERRSWAAAIPWASAAGGKQSHITGEPQLPHIIMDTQRTKSFSRPLSSFALAPPCSGPFREGPQGYLASNVMVVNHEGDLELYAVHDTPKQAVWNARGDLIISAGVDARVIICSPEFVEDPERSQARSGDESVVRGRQKTSMRARPVVPPAAALSSRGDEDCFPALGSADLTALPSNYRKSRSKEPRIWLNDRGPVGMSSRAITASNSRARKGISRVDLFVENDISMVMKLRANMGYCLNEPERNISVVKESDPFGATNNMLANLWVWICQSHEYLNLPTSYINGYNFKNQGLLSIWEGFAPTHSSTIVHSPSPQNRQLSPEHSEMLGPVPTSISGPTFRIQERRRPGHSHPHTPIPMHMTLSHANTPMGHPHTPIDEAQSHFQTALEMLFRRTQAGKVETGNGSRPWMPPVQSTKVIQRQIALKLCGWSLKEEEIEGLLKKWETEGKVSRAACWMVFLKQYNKAIALLMKSQDESHRMMSGTIAALIPYTSLASVNSRPLELREHYERVIKQLQDPYFRALLTYLALNDWSEVLDERSLPFRERLAIAFHFLDDKAVGIYLRRCVERAVQNGDIDVLTIAGIGSRKGTRIMQSYVDRTGDVQSVALLGSLAFPPKSQSLNDKRGIKQEKVVGKWVECYQDLLDGFRMFHHRVAFDIERGQLAFAEAGVSTSEGGIVSDWVPKQILIRCNYCNKPLSPEQGGGSDQQKEKKSQPTMCPHCGRGLPRCSICLMTLSIARDATRDADLLQSQTSYKDLFQDAIVMCQTCRHGGHVTHILDWFYGQDGGPSHNVCPVADCNCRCVEEM